MFLLHFLVAAAAFTAFAFDANVCNAAAAAAAAAAVLQRFATDSATRLLPPALHSIPVCTCVTLLPQLVPPSEPPKWKSQRRLKQVQQ